MRKSQISLFIILIFSFSFFLGCKKKMIISPEILKSYDEKGFRIVNIENRKEYMILSYEYYSDLDSVGYSRYGIYKGDIYLKLDDNEYDPLLNIIKEKKSSFGEKIVLEKKEENMNKILLEYYIEPNGQKSYGSGKIKIIFEYDNGNFKIIDFVSDVKSTFSLDIESDLEYPDIDGEIIYQVNITKNDFMKIILDKQLGF